MDSESSLPSDSIDSSDQVLHLSYSEFDSKFRLSRAGFEISAMENSLDDLLEVVREHQEQDLYLNLAQYMDYM